MRSFGKRARGTRAPSQVTKEDRRTIPTPRDCAWGHQQKDKRRMASGGTSGFLKNGRGGERSGVKERRRGPRSGGKEMRPGADREVRRNGGKAVPTTVRRKG